MDVAGFLGQFAHPDSRFSPAPIWWWSGERLEIDRLRWQMDQLLAMGIRNVVILNLAPSGPLFGSDADDPPFLSPEWWWIFEQVCDHARDIGMSIWFYDQIGFSGANYQAELVAAHPEFAAEQIRVISIEGQGSLRLDCPGSGTPIGAYVVSFDRAGEPKAVTLDGRTASVDVTSPAKLCLAYTVRQGYDYYSRAACEKLLDTVHRQFAARLPQHLGTTIVGSFQDELPDLPTWGRDFAASFARSSGYRLENCLHHLFEPGGPEARRTRLHYHQHRADLAEEALFKPFFQWHQRHGIQCGFDQQSPAREARAIGCVQKYADYIRTHRWYAAPGCDLHGNAKLHSSIAFLSDRPRVWIEGFHSTGWGGTIADTFDWLLPFLRAGSNLYNPHAVYYSTRMGWWEWAPPSTCWRQPYARHYRGFADMISRLTKLLSVGVQQADVAVLFPTATVQSAMTPQSALSDAKAADETLHQLIGSMRWHEAALGVLDSIPIDFHLLDDATIASADISDGAISHRGVSFRTILLPHITVADDAVIAGLKRFAHAGGRIVAVGASCIESPTGDMLDVASLPNAIFVATPQEVAAVLNDAPRAIRAAVPTLYRRLDALHILFVPATAGMTTQVKWADWFANLESATLNPERYLREAQTMLPPGARTVWRYDPVHASTSPLAVSSDGVLRLDFAGAPFAVLVWSDAEDATAPPAESGAAKTFQIELSRTWSGAYVPTLPTGHADIFDPRRPELRMPHTAELCWAHGAGDDSWARGLPDEVPAKTVRAGFGVNGWITTDGDPSARPLVYSPVFGIAQDPIHLHRLGPKGHVPEEFIDVGTLQEGASAQVRTGIESDREMEVVLAVGANARKSVSLNGVKRSAPLDGAYLWMSRLTLQRGSNELELRLTAERTGNVRAFWCLLRPGNEAAFTRPERIVPPDPPVAGARLVYRRVIGLEAGVTNGRLQVAAAAVVAVYIDGTLLGRQGGFDPYAVQMRAQAYDLPRLPAGQHELAIELIEPQSGAPLLVDLRATDAGGRTVTCLSDAAWEVSRNGSAFVGVHLSSQPVGDAASWHLYRRPHALPRAAWIEGEQPRDIVLDLPLSPPMDEPQPQWFQWLVPPGATSMRLPLREADDVRLWIDERAATVDGEGNVSLGDSRSAARRAVLRVNSRQLGGGIFADPIFYRFAEGTFAIGSWLAQGLRSYSGALRMRQTFQFDGNPNDAALLDLGRVRGSVEASLNGKPLGARFIPPFTFDVSGALHRGENELEIVTANALANFLSTWSPTRGWSKDQFEAGVFGPVVIRLPASK